MRYRVLTPGLRILSDSHQHSELIVRAHVGLLYRILSSFALKWSVDSLQAKGSSLSSLRIFPWRIVIERKKDG